MEKTEQSYPGKPAIMPATNLQFRAENRKKFRPAVSFINIHQRKFMKETRERGLMRKTKCEGWPPNKHNIIFNLVMQRIVCLKFA